MKQRERFEIELNTVGVRLAQAGMVIVLGTLVAVGLTQVSIHDGFMGGLCLLIALLPFGLAPTVRLLLHRKTKPNTLTLHDLHKAVRCTLAQSASQVVTVLIGLVGLAWWHSLPVLTIGELIAADLVVVLPITSLRWDEAETKHLPSAAKDRILDTRSLKRYVGFGVLTAAVTYGNYLLFFARHQLSPLHIEASLPMHHQATSVALVTLVFCGLAYLFFERSDSHKAFFTDYLTSNTTLLMALPAALLLLIVVIYVPGLQSLLGTSSIGFIDWLSAVVAAGLYMILRLVQRHTRQHSHHAVLRLHHETKSN